MVALFTCQWCRGTANVIVVAGCLNLHVFDFPFCLRCAFAVQSAYCPTCKERLAESITIPLSEAGGYGKNAV